MRAREYAICCCERVSAALRALQYQISQQNARLRLELSIAPLTARAVQSVSYRLL